MNNRDDFSSKIKRILAGRVAWKCSFPGCTNATIGPGNETKEDVVILGEAAHITAAAPNGPRYDPSMSTDERKSINNGIWMCRQHARLIDSDFINYSVSTLNQWKQLAENQAYENLRLPQKNPINISSTLIQLGYEIVFEGYWKYADEQIWKFVLNNYVYGDEYKLKEYCSNFASIDEIQKFIIIESQGDGRIIIDNPSWEFNEKLELTIKVAQKTKRVDPSTLGYDLAIGRNGNLLLDNGDLGTVSGEKLAIQIMSIVLSTSRRENQFYPHFGSIFRKYFSDYKDKVDYLHRLLKLEISRLSTIPELHKEEDKSPILNFINRILEIEIRDIKPSNKRIDVNLKVEWGNNDIWKGEVWIYVG